MDRSSSFNSPELQNLLELSPYRLTNERDCLSEKIGCRMLWKSRSSDFKSFDKSSIFEQEKQRAMANEMIAKLTSSCWDKCITGAPGSKFSNSEQTCLSNCAHRYLEMSMLIVKRFQSMQ